MVDTVDVSKTTVPVITIDGPSGSGKGTLSQLLAKTLGWHFLDSGALYRVLALAAESHHINTDNIKALTALAAHLDVQFTSENNIILEGTVVTNKIRLEKYGNLASIVSAYLPVREALLARQRAFREMPGLVTDGRDMGTVVFPDADLKIFLEASLEARAKRRLHQLQEKAINDSLERVLAELALRDKRDRERTASPLKPAEGAWKVDTTELSAEAVFNKIIAVVGKQFAVGGRGS